jgi:hypothetical protein
MDNPDSARHAAAARHLWVVGAPALLLNGLAIMGRAAALFSIAIFVIAFALRVFAHRPARAGVLR